MTEQTLFILASLLDGPKHGYAIAQEARELSGERMRLTAGTLYGALERLTDEGLVEPDREEVVNGRRRRYFRLTGAGAAAIEAETQRLRATAQAVEARLGRPRTA